MVPDVRRLLPVVITENAAQFEDPARREPTSRRADDAVPHVPDSAPGKVALVVERDTNVRRLAAEVVQALGYTVLLAADGLAALELLSRTQVHIALLVTAVMMDNMSGLELAAQLRSRWRGLRVVYLSGETDLVSVNGIMHPCSISLRKPFIWEQLECKVVALLAPQ